MFHFNAEAGYVDAATWAVLLARSSKNPRDGAMLTQLHETAHFFQAVGTRFLYWLSVYYSFSVSVTNICLLPGVTRREEIAKQRDLLRPMLSCLGALWSPASKIRPIDVIEGHATYVAHRIQSAGASSTAIHLALLNELDDVPPEYSTAYLLATQRLGSVAVDAFGPICYVALQHRSPGEHFCRLVDWLSGEKSLLQELARPDVPRCIRCGKSLATRAERDLVRILATTLGPAVNDFLPVSAYRRPDARPQHAPWGGRVPAWKDPPPEIKIACTGDLGMFPIKGGSLLFAHQVLDAYLSLFIGIDPEFLMLAFSRPYRACVSCGWGGCGEENSRYQVFCSRVLPPMYFFKDTASIAISGLGETHEVLVQVALRETIRHAKLQAVVFDNKSYDEFLRVCESVGP